MDAFYNLEPGDPSVGTSACVDCFRYNRISETGAECIGLSRRVSSLIAGPYPPYRADHVYTVRLSLGAAPPERLVFTISDCGCGDNAGMLEVSIQLPCEP